MALQGSEFAQVRDAVVSAFNRSDFDMFVRDRLSFDAEVEVEGGGLKKVVDGVLARLVNEGREWQLVHEVALARPLRTDIQEIYRRYARAVLDQSKRAAVDANVQRAYEGLGLAPPVCVQEHGVTRFESSTGGGGLQAIVVPGLQNLDVAQWRELWIRRERCVCRVEIEGRPRGTGFLVGPQALLTNYHVLEPVIVGEVAPASVVFRFDYKKLADLEVSPGVEIGVDAAEWLVDASPYSPGEKNGTPETPAPTSDQLDFALVRLARAFGDDRLAADDPESPARGWIRVGVTSPPIHEAMPLLILQHPLDAPLQLGIDTNAVTKVGPLRVRYATNTERGSSGSPCFDWNWNLVALHHYGDPDFGRPSYNQGIPIRAIRERVERSGRADNFGGS